VKLFHHYCHSGFSNGYLLGTDSAPWEAVIIDPGRMDSELLRMIEDNNYALKGILITHDHVHHVRGLKTLMQIYDTGIYAISSNIGEHRTIMVRDGDTVNIGPFRTEVISIPGHSADSAVFRIGRVLFTGDTLSAGFVGSTASSFAEATQINALRSKILSLPGDFTILPGHGPPSSLEAERRFNLDINSFQPHKNRRPSFKMDL
jgi:glyoxylase-like metal-dependent hydrolase (beta-lactamase superfamily II)